MTSPGTSSTPKNVFMLSMQAECLQLCLSIAVATCHRRAYAPPDDNLIYYRAFIRSYSKCQLCACAKDLGLRRIAQRAESGPSGALMHTLAASILELKTFTAADGRGPPAQPGQKLAAWTPQRNTAVRQYSVRQSRTRDSWTLPGTLSQEMGSILSAPESAPPSLAEDRAHENSVTVVLDLGNCPQEVPAGEMQPFSKGTAYLLYV